MFLLKKNHVVSGFNTPHNPFSGARSFATLIVIAQKKWTGYVLLLLLLVKRFNSPQNFAFYSRHLSKALVASGKIKTGIKEDCRRQESNPSAPCSKNDNVGAASPIELPGDSAHCLCVARRRKKQKIKVGGDVFTLMVRTLEATLLPRSDLHRFTSRTSLNAACPSKAKRGRGSSNNYMKAKYKS